MNDIIYCDKCHKPIDAQPTLDHQYIFCPECAAKLYQKIFGNQEDER